MISQTNLLSAIAQAEWCAMRGKRKSENTQPLSQRKSDCGYGVA